MATQLESSSDGTCAQHVTHDVREPGEFLPIPSQYRDDGASPCDRQRDADAGTWTIACALSTDQMVDASCQDVEVLVVDPGVIRCRINVWAGEDRDQSEGRIWIQAITHRQASQPGPDAAVAGDRSEEFIKRRPTCGHVAREQLALRRPIALADRQRGHLAPQQQPATELHQALRWLAPSGQFGRAVGPHHQPRLGIGTDEQDQPLTLCRRDRAGRELEREDSVEVEPACLDRPMGCSDELVERRCDEAHAKWIGRVVAARARPQRGDSGFQVAGIRVDVCHQVGELDARSQLLGGVHRTVRQRRDDRVDVRQDVGDDVASSGTHRAKSLRASARRLRHVGNRRADGAAVPLARHARSRQPTDGGSAWLMRGNVRRHGSGCCHREGLGDDPGRRSSERSPPRRSDPHHE